MPINETTAPRIYAACLASYNNGRLHGAWIDCDGLDGDDLRNAIDDMLAESSEPNVMRRKCPDCGRWHTDARPYRENDDDCNECGATLPAEFVPSAEEWAIHDHEGFGCLIDSEWPALDDVAAIAAILADDDDDKRRGLVWLVNDRGYSLRDAISKCEDVRTADWTPEEYAEELAADCFGVTDDTPLAAYIDYGRFARDLILGGDIDECDIDGKRFLIVNASEF